MRFRIRLYWAELDEFVEVDEACTKERALASAQHYIVKFPMLSGNVFDIDKRWKDDMGCGVVVKEWGEVKEGGRLE